MSSFKMLLLGTAFLYFIGQVIGYSISNKEASDHIDKLMKFLNSKDTSNTENIDQKFAKLLDSLKEEGEKKLIFSRIVPMYLKMFTSLKDTEVKESITNLSQMLHQSNEDFLKKSREKMNILSELENEPVSDIKFQRSAMKDLLRILRDINVLQHPRKPNPPKCRRESRLNRKRREC